MTTNGVRTGLEPAEYKRQTNNHSIIFEIDRKQYFGKTLSFSISKELAPEDTVVSEYLAGFD